jgi:hypothetical protein
MFKFLSSHEKIFLLSIFVLGLALSVVYFSNQLLVQDSVQLLERGYFFSKGYLFPFGPRSTNTNYVYGPFISIFVGSLLKVYQHPLSPLLGLLVLHIGSFFLLLKTTFLTKNAHFFLVFIFFYWVSPWRTSEVFLWNPSFLFPLSALWLFGLDLCLRNKSFSGSFLMVTSIAITFQIHNSVLFLLVLTALLMITKSIRIHYLGATIAGVMGLILLLPTIYVILNYPEILDQNQKKAPLFHNLIQGGEAIKGLLYWFRYPSLYFGATTFQLPKLTWGLASSVEKLWFVIKWMMAILSLVLVLVANIRFFRSSENVFLKRLCIHAFGALLFVSCLSPVPFNFWHLYLIFPFTLIPLSDYLSTHKKIIFFLAPVAIYFSVYALITSTRSYKHNSESNQSRSYEMIQNNLSNIEKNFQKYSLKVF